MRKFYCYICLIVAVVFLLRLPGYARENSDQGPKDNILRYALHSSKMGSLDPDFAKGSQNHTYADMVFNSLWRYVPGDARYMEPDLAAEMPRFKMVRGRQVWRIHLRHKVYFHDSPYCKAHELTA